MAARLLIGLTDRRLLLGVVLSASLLCVSSAEAASSHKFVSHRYGYSLVLPGAAGRWNASYALLGWSTSIIEPGLPGFDSYLDTESGRRVEVGARRPPHGTTLAKWTAYVIGLTCAKPSPTQSRLSGVRAEVFRWKCDDLDSIAITAVRGSRGYFMWLASPVTLSLASNRRAFLAAQDGFRFSRHPRKH